MWSRVELRSSDSEDAAFRTHRRVGLPLPELRTRVWNVLDAEINEPKPTQSIALSQRVGLPLGVKMARTITWLHLSDLHARLKDDWDARMIVNTLVQDLQSMQQDHHLRPDLVFFTGDAAYGTVDGERMQDQYEKVRAFFDAVRKAFDPEIPLRDFYTVPGNHDVERGEITPDQTAWLRHKNRTLIEINAAIRDDRKQWRAWMDRLSAYRNFVTAYGLLHLEPEDPRLIWADAREIAGVRVGITGLNSAWSCADDEDKGRIWCGSDWQISELVRRMGPVDLAFALIHHPGNWFTDREDPAMTRRLRQEFPLVLHGHEHVEWVEVDASGKLILSAGACYECSWMENGYSIGRLDLERSTGVIRLRQWDKSGRGWVARNIATKTQDGVWPLTNLSWLPRPTDGATKQSQSSASTFEALSPAAGETAAEHYTRKFCRHVIEQHDILELFGCEIPRELQRYQLSVAYISLNLSADSEPETENSEPLSLTPPDLVDVEEAHESIDDNPSSELPGHKLSRKEDRTLIDDASIEEVLDSLAESTRRLLILGPAGAGKSTLLRWCAIQSARGVLGGLGGEASENDRPNLSGNAARSWRQQVPILIRLRECPAGTLPAANDLAHFLAKHLPSPPVDWMTKILDDGRALVLLDGVDEVHRDKRAQLAEEIGELIRTYPRCTYVVSTRAGAIEEGWLDRWNFTEAQVEPMSRRDRDEFIVRWYRAAALELKNRPRPGEDLSRTAQRLRTEVADRPELAALATNPLLCAMICALYRERQERLPETPSELCEALCHMLVHRRERETLGLGDAHFDTTWRDLTYAQKKSLLADLAWHMANKGESSIESSAAISLIATGLGSTPGRTPSEAPVVLQALVERSGLLRTSGDERVDFLHNTLKEYLAAGLAVERGDYLPLVEHSDDAAWQPIVLFALSLGGEPFNSALVAALLSRAQSPRVPKAPRASRSLSKREKHALQRTKAREFFLVRCRTVAKRLDASHSKTIDKIARRFLPPVSMRDTEAMAAIGERVLLYGTNNLSAPDWWAEQSASVAIRCLRLLRGVGGRVASSMLSAIDRLPSSSSLLMNEWMIASNELSPDTALPWPFLKRSDVDISGTKIRDLRPLAALQSTTELNIFHVSASDLSPLSAITTLEKLRLTFCPISDLTPLGELTNLKYIHLSWTRVGDLSPLIKLNHLRELLVNNSPVTDVEPLSKILSLERISLLNLSISDLAPLANLPSLNFLRLYKVTISDLLPLGEFTGLKNLRIDSMHVASLPSLSKLTSLEELSLMDAHVEDLSPLVALPRLLRLILSENPISDLSELHDITTLKHLLLDGTSVRDLEPIANLTSLITLSLAGTSVIDLGPISKLQSLETLNISHTRVQNLESLAGLRSLGRVILTDTPVTDLSPLAQTPVRILALTGTHGWELQQLFGCTSLRRLIVDRDMFSDDEIAVISKRMPKVSVSQNAQG